MNIPVNSSQLDLPLPPGFLTIEDIRNLPNDKIAAMTMIKSVFGFVKDFQPPKKCDRGTDYKCAIEIKDLSTKYESYGFKVDVFWSEPEKMPKFSGPGDVVLIRNVKVQMRSGSISLIANRGTVFHVLLSKKIPRKDSPEIKAPWQSYPPGKSQYPPNVEETNYVIWAHCQSQDMGLPSSNEFQQKSIQAIQGRNHDKFSLLKDIKPEGRWHDILGQVIRLYDSNLFSIYLSDYTYNKYFHKYSWPGVRDESGSRDGDEFAYTKFHDKHKDQWPGPFGQYTIQLTLFDEHASFARENLKVGQWVLLSNVQMQMGKNGGTLEGFVRGDRGKINVRILEQAEGKDCPDPRLKDALRRKMKYESIQKKQILSEDGELGNKRKAEDGESLEGNSKQRRKAMRAAAEKSAADLEAKEAARLNLNNNIRCAHPTIEPSPIEVILRPEMIVREGSVFVPSSFTCKRYRANVRVIDYAPDRIEDFAVWRRVSEYDQLSDYSGGEDTDIEEDMRSYKNGKGYAKKIWEWRFWLKVEDANPKGPKKRMWIIVDNHAAQGLLGLENDAANLRKEPDLLAALKEQLFKLWGDLEEQKSAALPPQSTANKKTPSPIDSTAKSPASNIYAQPDLDSDSETEEAVSKPPILEKKLSALNDQNGNTPSDVSNGLKPKNKAFTCCIQQYGIKEPEKDRSKANAGDGRRWQRIFGLFGTQIL
ncbi:uncharacterized protein L3040_002351 [Drepanopeziza brunnea f. sp. 'multigermtubi']|uniref:Protection of telomeres protein 1 n=1 Tax=Marssonina brunnea f. sp. multigermtubi (strain MB_m1) TaxID=1072389 RepID=K1WQP4_MARBU|nr:telomere-binding alpha subunit central domain-containing protein [Drepanopeziza brunnea f. sp. 'multigermtubi' MB_m1]EKD19970.1 telomere-binding alpha subunit central domain-containing protein [Drepanopeziza brunnea f. sp. 'multigermtubi' MB_m1]KAJ5050468.1 hypothetical protein L3040_002351 [Drepanopeziza brunnea f. sp. 'multigermtubi']